MTTTNTATTTLDQAPTAAPATIPTAAVDALRTFVAQLTTQEASSAARAAAYGARDKVRDRDLSAAAAYNARGVACVMHAYSLSNDKGSLGARRTVAELARCVMAASDTYERAYRDEGTLDAALEAAAALAWAITDVDAYVRQVGRSECY